MTVGTFRSTNWMHRWIELSNSRLPLDWISCLYQEFIGRSGIDKDDIMIFDQFRCFYRNFDLTWMFW